MTMRLRLSAEALCWIRTTSGLSQGELAQRSGISQGHISELEQGDKDARPATIRKLAVALDVRFEDLLEEKGLRALANELDEILKRR